MSSQIHDFFLSPSPPDICKSRVDFSHDGSSWTRRVVTNRHHVQKVPRTFFQIATSCYVTSANTTTRLLLDGSSSPKSRPDSVRVYWTTLSLTLRNLATKPARVFLKTNGAKTEETHLEKGGQPKEGNEMKNSLETFQPIIYLTTRSTCYQGASNLSQRD